MADLLKAQDDVKVRPADGMDDFEVEKLQRVDSTNGANSVVEQMHIHRRLTSRQIQLTSIGGAIGQFLPRLLPAHATRYEKPPDRSERPFSGRDRCLRLFSLESARFLEPSLKSGYFWMLELEIAGDIHNRACDRH